MDSKKYEQELNYKQELLKRIDLILDAIQEGKTGAVETDNLLTILTPEIEEYEDTLKKIAQVEKETESETEKLLKSWTVPMGHRANNKFTVQKTPEREDAMNRLIARKNQQIIHILITTLSKLGMLLTSSTNMPGGLIR